MTVVKQDESVARGAQLDRRAFDGVVCFGGSDWWYHNRAHYDLQMMRELRKRVPVLYVNSIGVRVPKLSEGGMFVRRVRRKLKSFARLRTDRSPFCGHQSRCDSWPIGNGGLPPVVVLPGAACRTANGHLPALGVG